MLLVMDDIFVLASPYNMWNDESYEGNSVMIKMVGIGLCERALLTKSCLDAEPRKQRPTFFTTPVQGDQAPCSKGCVDIKTKVAF